MTVGTRQQIIGLSATGGHQLYSCQTEGSRMTNVPPVYVQYMSDFLPVICHTAARHP
jgi:hypothetical protein